MKVEVRHSNFQVDEVRCNALEVTHLFLLPWPSDRPNPTAIVEGGLDRKQTHKTCHGLNHGLKTWWTISSRNHIYHSRAIPPDPLTTHFVRQTQLRYRLLRRLPFVIIKTFIIQNTKTFCTKYQCRIKIHENNPKVTNRFKQCFQFKRRGSKNLRSFFA